MKKPAKASSRDPLFLYALRLDTYLKKKYKRPIK